MCSLNGHQNTDSVERFIYQVTPHFPLHEILFNLAFLIFHAPENANRLTELGKECFFAFCYLKHSDTAEALAVL